MVIYYRVIYGWIRLVYIYLYILFTWLTTKWKIEIIKKDEESKFYQGNEIIDFFTNINQYGVCEVSSDN